MVGNAMEYVLLHSFFLCYFILYENLKKHLYKML